MWNEAGVVRSGSCLKRALHRLQELEATVGPAMARRCHEARNLQQTGWLIARSALAREESRGGALPHRLSSHNDQRFLKHSVVAGNAIRVE